MTSPRAKVIQRTPPLQSRPESDSGDAQTGYLDREGNGRRKSAHVRLEEYSGAGATQQHRIVGRGRWNLTKQLHVTTDQELASLIVSQLEGTAKDAVEGEDPEGPEGPQIVWQVQDQAHGKRTRVDLTPAGHERIQCISRRQKKKQSWCAQAPCVKHTEPVPNSLAWLGFESRRHSRHG